MILNGKSLLIFITLINLMFADVIVELPNGLIQGRIALTQTQSPYYAFEKIPYAAPPVGSLRFKAPVPPNNWDGILNTTQLDVTCYQMGLNTEMENEDCLYINVYTPQVHLNLPQEGIELEKLPVMVWIYGGAFRTGDSLHTTYGPEYLIDHNVIVVTFNYRLGAFGFLSTQDLVITGNYGLKDQHFAIQWVHSNVDLFGGDSEKITIFGESAGSVSVAYQLLNPKSEGLFRGAICESGSYLSPWALQRNARDIAFKTVSFINESIAESNDSTVLLQFLMEVPASDIDDAATKMSGLEGLENINLWNGLFYSPVIEPEHPEAVVTKKMYVTLNEGNIIKVPTIIGINSQEGLAFVGNVEQLQTNLEEFDKHLDWLVPSDMNVQDEDLKLEIGNSIRNLYAGEESLASNLSFGVKLYSDNAFTRSIIKHAELQSKFTPVYFYQFSYSGLLGKFLGIPDIGFIDPENVPHAEEKPYLWRIQSDIYNNSDLSKFPEQDIVTQKRMLELWTNFAKDLNPTPRPSDLLQNITWPEVVLGEEENILYLDIGENLQVKSDPKKETYAGWNTIYNNLDYNDFDTY